MHVRTYAHINIMFHMLGHIHVHEMFDVYASLHVTHNMPHAYLGLCPSSNKPRGKHKVKPRDMGAPTHRWPMRCESTPRTPQSTRGTPATGHGLILRRGFLPKCQGQGHRAKHWKITGDARNSKRALEEPTKCWSIS